MNDALPTSAEFRRRVMGLSYTYSALALAVLIPCLYSVLGLTGAQWRWFLGSALAYTLLVTVPQTLWHRRTLGSIPAYLDAAVRGEGVEHGGAPLRVRMRRDEAPGLVVAPQPRRLRRGQRVAVDQDAVLRGHVARRARQHLAVDAYAALRDPALRVAA